MQIAMIGAGGIAQRHLHVLANEPDVKIVGHVAPRRESIDAAVQRWGGRGYQDINSLLDNETVDAAWITVPPGEHGAIEFALLERNIPFFVEKPLSSDRDTAEKIAEMVAQTGTLAGVGYHWRALDVLAGVRAALAENPARMVLGRWHDSTPPPLWWRHQATSGGQMVEQATHLVDLARYLLGEAKVTSSLSGAHHRPVYPDADVASVSAALLQFSNHTVGVFSATCLLPAKDTVHLQIICDGLLITIEQTHVVYDRGREKHEIRVGNDPFVTENRAFIQAVLQNDSSLLYSSYADAMRTHWLCHDIHEIGQV
jgi:myo-inositol 2-dehydrogenase/D-chiro-inositol 1-dehydrogenase